MQARAFFGEVDPVRRQKCGSTRKRGDSTKVETALAGEGYMKTSDSGSNGSVQPVGPLHAYLAGIGHEGRGRFVHEVLGYSNRRLEEVHDYIQWLFPLPTRSAAQPSAPVLTDFERDAISSDPRASSNLGQAKERMLRFYRETDDWLKVYDHNHLRITRIIQSLKLILSPEAAHEFYNTILELHNAAGEPVNDRSLQYWKQASEE